MCISRGQRPPLSIRPVRSKRCCRPFSFCLRFRRVPFPLEGEKKGILSFVLWERDNLGRFSLSLSFSLRLAFPRGVALRFEGARKTRELLRTRIVPPLERRSIKLFPGFFCRCEKDAEPRFASIPSARLFISVSLSLVLPPPRKKTRSYAG